MKKALSILYWILAIVVVAVVMLSFHYRIAEAVFIGTMFLPGAVAAKFAFSKISSEDKSGRIKGGIFATLGIMVGEVFLMFLAHYVIVSLRVGPQEYYNWPALPSVLQNPVFLSIMIAALSVGSVFFDRLLEKKYPSGPKSVTFLSDRHPVTIAQGDILFIESNDTVTIVHSKDGAEYKNKTPISQWESILDCGFVRIHRSFFVNRDAVTSVEGDTVCLGDIELPVSRKYKAKLNSLLR